MQKFVFRVRIINFFCKNLKTFTKEIAYFFILFFYAISKYFNVLLRLLISMIFCFIGFIILKDFITEMNLKDIILH